MNEKVLRTAIVGCGNIFPMHAVPVRKMNEAELVAVCDCKADRMQKAAAEFHCAGYADMDEMLCKEHPDVVHICTPHYLHAPLAVKALKSGCHVITEKPMAISDASALEMLNTSEQTGKTLAVIFQNRYNAGSQLIRKHMDDGSLGKAAAARMILTWDRSEEYYSKSDWKGTWEKEGGGVIIDQAIHTLDLMRWLTGGKVTSVRAAFSNWNHPNSHVEDTAQGRIQFESGAYGCFYAMNHFCTNSPVFLELICEKGRAVMEGPRAHIYLNDGRELIAYEDPADIFEYGDVKRYWGTSHVKQIRNFYRYLTGQEELYIRAEDAYETQKMVCAIYDSARENKVVFL
ncbi:MAG: Gfo/Idh/MocA family oxidoreductase [Clostridiaceae bacterium]|nr:Gfo/Idh/MocA family oxidoreductase [Clostridiaceae bacterium]